MKISYWLLFGLIAGLSSCMWGVPNKQKADITTDTLTYNNHDLIQGPGDGCMDKPDSGNCSTMTLKYPVFNNQQLLNDTVMHKLLKMLALNGKIDTNIHQLIENYLKLVDKKQAYKIIGHVNILRQDSSLLTLSIDAYTTKIAAQPYIKTNFINWNTKAKKDIGLNDIFTDGYMDKLTKIADTIFRNQEKLSYTASLANDYFFKNSQFALNNNYSINPLGIRFLYNYNEIKPYAAGQTDLFIPYSKIKSLLRPNTVITQYIK